MATNEFEIINPTILTLLTFTPKLFTKNSHYPPRLLKSKPNLEVRYNQLPT